MPAQNVRHLLSDYLFQHDLKPTTEKYYRRIVSTFCTWAGCVVSRAKFKPQLVSEFLRYKQEEGLSSYYRKSLRSGLRALLNHNGQTGSLRSVSLDPLEPESWSEGEVVMLVSSVDKAIMPNRRDPKAQHRRWFWKKVIPMAYYTGLERIDLADNFSNDKISPNGLVITARHKTGKRVIAQLPMSLTTELLKRPPGPLFEYKLSEEMFRREFESIVAIAGLEGTFKKVRKTTGTVSEIKNPGRGHELLANSRAIFDKHYLDKKKMPIRPLSPSELPLTG